MPSLAGKTIYIRRLRDTRSTSERRVSLQLSNTAPTRAPVRDFVLQLAPGAPGVNRQLSQDEVLLVTESARIDTGAGAAYEAEVSIRRGNGYNGWQPDRLYRRGEVITYQQKHFSCMKEHVSAQAFEAANWQESFVHMESDYRAEDSRFNEAPIITFDGDSDGSSTSRTLGYDLTTAWASDPEIRRQYQAATDYKGVQAMLRAFGVSEADTEALLTPRPIEDRTVDPQTPPAGMTPPADAVAGWGNWPIQWHRPSVIRLFGQAWEWAGTGNYTTAIPRYQTEMSPQNKFSYFFTNQTGGRVYGTGSNEDGFLVTPAGLQDTSTGQQISVDQVGETKEELDAITTFAELEVGELNVDRQGVDRQPGAGW